MNVVAFGNQSRVGKNSCAMFLAQYLAEVPGHNPVRIASFADRLKKVSYDLFRHWGLRPGDFYELESGAVFRDIKLEGINMTPVEIWIAVGQKMREVYPEVWAESVFTGNRHCETLIISDLRFPNEAALVKARGGLCVKVTRKDAPPPKASDNMLPEDFAWDYVIENDGTLEQLQEKVVQFARSRFL